MRTKNKFPLRDIIKRRRRDEQSDGWMADCCCHARKLSAKLNVPGQPLMHHWQRGKLCTLAIALALSIQLPAQEVSAALFSHSLAVADLRCQGVLAPLPHADGVLSLPLTVWSIVPFNFTLICQSYQNVNYRPSEHYDECIIRVWAAARVSPLRGAGCQEHNKWPCVGW